MDYKELFYKDSVEKQVTIKSDDGLINITNSELEGETIELTESICSENELTFGACSAAELKFTVSDIQTPLQGKWLSVDIELKSEDISANPYRLGRYKVYSDKPTVDRTSRDVVAYDMLYDIINADVADWYNSVLPEKDSAVRLKKFRDSFFEHFGVTQEDIALVNDNMWVERTVELSELSGAMVINCICEINGCMGHINRSGLFEYVYLKPISNPEDISKSLYTSATYEDYIVKPIDKLQIRQENDDIGVIVGDGCNSYIIEDNFLVYGKSSSNLSVIANNILSKIKKLAYRPFTVECIGNPCISLGVAVSVTSTYVTINSYVLTRTLKGVQSLSDTYEAVGEEYRTSKVNGVHKQIIQLKNKANILNRSIEETRNTITDVENGLKNEILATTSEFDVKLQSLQSQVDGEIEVINGHGQPTLYNYPAYNWVAGPKVGDTLTQGLRFTYLDAVYNKHQRTLFFDEDTSTTYRFISKNGVWVWEPLANAEFSLLQKQITDLNVTAQGITQSVEQLSTKVTNEYITQIDAKTLVTTTADGIKEDISKVYSTTDYVNTLKASFDKTAEGLTAQISEVNEALDGANEVYTIRGQPTLYNYPAYNWTAGPKVGDKLTQGLRFTYSDESYRKHKRALVYDEAAGKTYRFIKSGSTWMFSDVGDTEFSFVNKKFAEYKATADGLSADLSRFETKVGSDYITKVDSQASIKLSAEELSRTFSKTYATQDTVSTMEMAIKEAADGLAIRVKKDDLITEINAQAGKVKIKSDAIDLTGLVTISALKESGKTVINGDNITTGTIRAERLDLTNYSTTRQVDAAIAAAERGIKSTVASSSNKWDYSNYWHTVDYNGYGTPWEAGYTDIGKYKNKTYLDIITGYVYYCTYDDGSYKLDDWFKDYECPVAITELKTSLEQTDKKFNWLVKSGDSEANMVLTDRVYQLVSENIDLTGLVTISSLRESGHTVINADNLATGTIKALTISGCTITGSAVAFANDAGGWNTIFNSEGMWIVGNGTVETPDFRVDKWGFLHLGDKLRMNPAGIWWTNNAGIEMFKSWSSFFGV